VSESDDNGKQLSMSASEVSHIMRYPNRRILYFTLQNRISLLNSKWRMDVT